MEAWLVETFDEDIQPISFIRAEKSKAEFDCFHYRNGVPREKYGTITPLGKIGAPLKPYSEYFQSGDAQGDEVKIVSTWGVGFIDGMKRAGILADVMIIRGDSLNEFRDELEKIIKGMEK